LTGGRGLSPAANRLAFVFRFPTMTGFGERRFTASAETKVILKVARTPRIRRNSFVNMVVNRRGSPKVSLE